MLRADPRHKQGQVAASTAGLVPDTRPAPLRQHAQTRMWTHVHIHALTHTPAHSDTDTLTQTDVCAHTNTRICTQRQARAHTHAPAVRIYPRLIHSSLWARVMNLGFRLPGLTAWLGPCSVSSGCCNLSSVWRWGAESREVLLGGSSWFRPVPAPPHGGERPAQHSCPNHLLIGLHCGLGHHHEFWGDTSL